MAKFAFAKLLATVFIFLGKLGIVCGNVVSCYYIMLLVFKDFEGSDKPNDGPVTSAAAPLIFVAAVTYMTASIFLGLMDTAVLSLLTSQSMDEDKNGEG